MKIQQAIDHLRSISVSDSDNNEFWNQLKEQYGTSQDDIFNHISETFGIDIDDMPKIYALAIHLKLNWDELEDIENKYNEFCYCRTSFLVLTDSEADHEFESYINNYIDDVVLPEIPKPYRNYFDTEKFTEDVKLDGRGVLSGYDRQEHEQCVNDTMYFIYRTN